ncbi:unnamed protein product [Cyprideis torosa]|uniref:Uncharacterized protein n=1 Tax=Cyprideis torosa TaxID=163714 RepID=A0A7R8ZMI1_9CRUS|nr:unnamed protein product [Cyprideis torosa]CAG0895556.1 unnamed protein product [Cyprideis torosa]
METRELIPTQQQCSTSHCLLSFTRSAADVRRRIGSPDLSQLSPISLFLEPKSPSESDAPEASARKPPKRNKDMEIIRSFLDLDPSIGLAFKASLDIDGRSPLPGKRNAPPFQQTECGRVPANGMCHHSSKRNAPPFQQTECATIPANGMRHHSSKRNPTAFQQAECGSVSGSLPTGADTNVFPSQHICLVLVDDATVPGLSQEILCVSLVGVKSKFQPHLNPEKQNSLRVKQQLPRNVLHVEISIFDIQIDNLSGGPNREFFQVVFTTLVPPSSPKPSASISAVCFTRQGALNRFKSLALAFPSSEDAPFLLNLETEFLHRLSTLLSSLLPPPAREHAQSSGQGIPPSVRVMAAHMHSPFAASVLRVGRLNLSVSLRLSLKVFLGLNQSRLSFYPLERKNVMTLTHVLGQEVAKHYLYGALLRAGSVVGSLDLLGSPSVLAREVRQGVSDLLNHPYQGLWRGPWAFLLGLSHGTSSFVQHLSSGGSRETVVFRWVKGNSCLQVGQGKQLSSGGSWETVVFRWVKGNSCLQEVADLTQARIAQFVVLSSNHEGEAALVAPEEAESSGGPVIAFHVRSELKALFLVMFKRAHRFAHKLSRQTRHYGNTEEEA